MAALWVKYEALLDAMRGQISFDSLGKVFSSRSNCTGQEIYLGVNDTIFPAYEEQASLRIPRIRDLFKP